MLSSAHGYYIHKDVWTRNRYVNNTENVNLFLNLYPFFFFFFQGKDWILEEFR